MGDLVDGLFGRRHDEEQDGRQHVTERAGSSIKPRHVKARMSA